MILLAIPLCILYFASGVFALLVDKRRKKNSSEQIGGSEIDRPEAL